MTFTPDPNCRVILLDIEGTTTPVSFVYEVLFPYARRGLEPFLQANWDSLQPELLALMDEREGDLAGGLTPPVLTAPTADEIAEYLHWLMDRDRKSTALKTIQGRIWQEGYQVGRLKSLFFDDVPAALEKWHQQGYRICIFSSGSVLAQQMLFKYTGYGDLTRFIGDWFDTTVGAKVDTSSYQHIAETLNAPTSTILFISDIVRELDAAASAGIKVLLSVRPGNSLQESSHQAITTFSEIITG